MIQDQFFRRFARATFTDYKAYLNMALGHDVATKSVVDLTKELDTLNDLALWELVSNHREQSA